MMTRTFNLLTIQIERCGVGNTNRKEGVTFFEHATLGTSLNDVIHARGVREHLHDRGGIKSPWCHYWMAFAKLAMSWLVDWLCLTYHSNEGHTHTVNFTCETPINQLSCLLIVILNTKYFNDKCLPLFITPIV